MVCGRGAKRGFLHRMSDPKLRRATFLKRKQSQKKKLYELTTLCDIEAFMLCVGPNGEIDTWPENPQELKRIIDRYMKIGKNEREKRMMGVSDFIDAQKKKLEEELSRVRGKNDEKMSSLSWDSRLDGFEEDSLRDVWGSIEGKLQKVRED
jgi:hypothetical protein